MFRWVAHHIIYRVLNFNLTIRNRTPLRVGAGDKPSLISPIDNPVITIKRHGIEIPYIPGSSLKGVFRSEFEKMFRSLGLYVCERGEGCGRRYYRDLQKLIKRGDIHGVIKLLSEKYCMACKVFGSSTFSSHVNISDFYPEGEYSLGARTGIAINRRSGSVRKGALYTIEYIEPGASFKGTITLTNLPNYIVGAFTHIFEMISIGIVRIGGMKSRGFGWVEMSVDSIDGQVYLRQGETPITIGKSIVLLPPLDDDDYQVEINPMDMNLTLNNFKEVWRKYAGTKKG